MILAQFDKIPENYTCFYGIIGQFLCAKFSVRKFGCAKELTFRRCDFEETQRRKYWVPRHLQNPLLSALVMFSLFFVTLCHFVICCEVWGKFFRLCSHQCKQKKWAFHVWSDVNISLNIVVQPGQPSVVARQM